MTFKTMKFRVRNSKHSKMIQMKLFELGYKWGAGGRKVLHTNMPYLYANQYGHISHGRTPSHFEVKPSPEMLIEPRTTYNLVEAPVAVKPETVELNGKTYLKVDLEAALAKLQPVK